VGHDAPCTQFACGADIGVGLCEAGDVLAGSLHRLGLRGEHLHVASLGSIGLCIALWIRAKTVGEDERGNAERRALFVGLWPPMFWLIGDSVDLRGEQRSRRRRLRQRLLGS
jgi:hypothetical protein